MCCHATLRHPTCLTHRLAPVGLAAPLLPRHCTHCLTADPATLHSLFTHSLLLFIAFLYLVVAFTLPARVYSPCLCWWERQGSWVIGEGREVGVNLPLTSFLPFPSSYEVLLNQKPYWMSHFSSLFFLSSPPFIPSFLTPPPSPLLHPNTHIWNTTSTSTSTSTINTHDFEISLI